MVLEMRVAFLKKGEAFLEKMKHKRCWGKWGFESGRFFFSQVFYKLCLCGYSLLNVKGNEKLINVLFANKMLAKMKEIGKWL